ncbi:hypothetical protein BT93_G0461 [Corymbia citriodora subsp. variegata]|nr:hypothetical protein BT93_G0461 [Corymbia citriodora subsp. variegata]
MSIDSAVSIVWDVLKCVAVPIKRQFGYVMSSKSYVQDLLKEVRELDHEAERVRNAAEVATNNSREVYPLVEKWQANVEKALKEAKDLLSDFERASKTCCYGSVPDPSCRYHFSRMAMDKIKDIKRLAGEGGGFKELDDISFSPTPGNVNSSSVKLMVDGVFESRASIIQDIMGALANNSNNVVGVYGMGGVGKSTLLEDTERRIREEKSFDLVAKADVSENPDIKRIQGEIAYALGLDIKDDEYERVRADRLRRRLENEKKKVLIILDNLWRRLDLKIVGIPCGHDNKVIGCKLLLTSRNRDILRGEMGCDRDFLLDGLQEEEAKKLFERIVGEKVHDDEFKPLVDEALHKCAGLPFLIVNIAKHFKHTGLFEWKYALKKIMLSRNEGLGEVINNMLQLSYDHLNAAEKSLLALCVAYGTSKPSLEDLVRHGVGWGLFREDNTIEEARASLRSQIGTLQASSLLLEDGDAYGFKIHDLVREFVASVASRDHPLLVLKDEDKLITTLPKDKLKSCRAVCFPYIDMKELPKELDCPELQIFFLFTFNKSLKIPDSLFYSMRKLMVLNLTGICLTCSPSPFQFLENLQTLCLDGCSLDDVAIIGELKGLRILSFVHSKIQRLPKEIGQLVELRLLDLNYCSKLEMIEPGVLQSLIKLEELYMKNSFDQWNAVEQTPPTNASLIELNHMTNLCTLHVSIPIPSVLPEDLNVKKLTKYNIQIGNPFRWSSNEEGSRTLELKLDSISDILHKGFIQSILGKIDDLFLDGLDGIEQSICALSKKGFPNLKYLQVKKSPSIHYIHQSSSHTEFPRLESLILEGLINLEKLCHNHIYTKSFSALKVVRVTCCDKLEVLFPRSSLRELPWLEDILVDNCKLMQGIGEADDCGNVELRNLRELKLFDLPYMRNFCKAGSTPSSSTSGDQVGTQKAFFGGQQKSK